MPQPLNVLSLFSGIGGADLAAKWAGFNTVGFCEIKPFNQKVLAKNFPGVPIHDDIKTLTTNLLAGWGIYPNQVDVIVGGDPCQPLSDVGRGMGEADDRYLWPEYFRLIKELRPRWVLRENVASKLGFVVLDKITVDLENEGYTARAFIIPACAVNAPHRRDRIFMVAHSGSKGLERVHDAGNEKHLQRFEETFPRYEWEATPRVLRRGHGLSAELDCIGGLENEFGDCTETNSKASELTRRLLFYVWEHQELAKTSPDLYRRGLRNCLPELPHSNTSSGWLLGQRIEKDKRLCDLWETFCTKPQQETQNLQRKLLERIRQTKRPTAVASVNDRIIALGNSIVPAQIYPFFKLISDYELQEQTHDVTLR